MDTQLKSAPAGAETLVIPGLIAEKERLMVNRTNKPEATDSKTTCKLFLELAADDLAKAKTSRNYYIVLSRKYGLTNEEIGSALGVTEARVRAIVTSLVPY